MNLIFTVGGFLFGFCGIILSIIFYLKSRRIRRFYFQVRSFSLITDSIASIPGFSSSFKGKHLANLTASKILLWNSGTEIISQEDISQNRPLTIKMIEGSEILDARISLPPFPGNKVSVKISQAEQAQLSFDYIAPKEGCIISLLHTGKAEDLPLVTGCIKGGGAPLLFRQPKYRNILPMLLSSSGGFFFAGLAKPLDILLGNVGIPTFIQKLITIVSIVGLLVLFLYLGILVDKHTKKKAGQLLDGLFNSPFNSSDFT